MSAIELRKLQREWYARLRAEGFDDVEYGREDGPLKVACRENRGIDVLDYETTLEYFSQAGEFLEHYEWSNGAEQEVWRRHVEGATMREIAAEHGRSVKWAFGIVRRLRRRMQAWRAKGRRGTWRPRRAKRTPPSSWGEQLRLPW